MNRAAVYFAVFVFCTGAWTLIGLSAFVGALHLWRLLTMLDPAWLVALALTASGALQLLIGLALHYARPSGLPLASPRFYAICRSGRHLAVIGAVLLAMGAGAVLAIEAGTM